MRHQDERDMDVMLAAYLDGELPREQSEVIERRIAAGDTKILLHLEELKAVRDYARTWCAEMTAEIASIDLWPALEARLRRELDSVSVHDSARTGASAKANVFGWRMLLRAFSKESRPGEFSRGFSWGFMGGVAVAGCASIAGLLLLRAPGDQLPELAGREMMPLISAPNGEVSAVARGGAGSGSLVASASAPGTLGSGVSVSGAAISEPGRYSREAAERPLAFVSAGKDVGAGEEIFASVPGFELPADLFASARTRDRDRQLIGDAFSVQLLSPGNLNPPGGEDKELVARLHGATAASTLVGNGTPPGNGAFGSAAGGLPGGSGLQGHQGTSGSPLPQNSPADVTWVSETKMSSELH